MEVMGAYRRYGSLSTSEFSVTGLSIEMLPVPFEAFSECV